MNRQRTTGFTLIELLVVLVLMGIMISMVVLSVGGQREKQLRAELQRLQQVMRLAHEEAILNRYELTIKFWPHAYEFQVQKDDKWVTLDTPDFMRRRDMEPDFEFSLQQDGIAAPLQDEDTGRILLSSSGETTPFELELRLAGTNTHYVLTGSAYGEFSIEGMNSNTPGSQEG
jgi:general secretion pathway protein H